MVVFCFCLILCLDVFVILEQLGGANFKVAAQKRSIYHPLRDMFAIHMMDEYENFIIPQLTKAEIFLPQKDQVWLKKVELIREYYVCTILLFFCFFVFFDESSQNIFCIVAIYVIRVN